MIALLRRPSPRAVIHAGTVLFAASISSAYLLYPHWVTLSHFAQQWNTLVLFVFAMLVAMFELAYVAVKVRSRSPLAAGFLYASAACLGLVVCVPYLGSATQKDLHDLFALLFALCAGAGFAVLAKRLRSVALGTLSGMIFAICLLELMFLANYAAHPVQPWVWTVLELGAIASLVAGLDVVVAVDKK